jgi:Flp pilus assembly protein TadD
MSHQEQFDEATFDFSQGEFQAALTKLKVILAEDSNDLDARLALAMCYYRLGDYAQAIVEGHKAETIDPRNQLVHTNLSLFYIKAGDKQRAEHHVAQARVAAWKEALRTTPAADQAGPG